MWNSDKELTAPSDSCPKIGGNPLGNDSYPDFLMSRGLYCLKHPDVQCTLWCVNCESMICDTCFDASEHESHSVRKLRSYLNDLLINKVNQEMGGSVDTYLQHLNFTIAACDTEITRLRKQLKPLETHVDSLKFERSSVENYLDIQSVGTDVENLQAALALLNLRTCSNGSAKKLLYHSKISKVRKKVYPKPFYVSFSAPLPILSKRPPYMRTSESIVLGNYEFWICGVCKDSTKYFQNSFPQKSLWIEVFCSFTGRKKKSLAPCHSDVEVVIENQSQCSRDFLTKAPWKFQKTNKIVFECMLYSDVLSPELSWLNDETGCLDVKLGLKFSRPIF